MCQGGDFLKSDGTGSYSIYGEKFEVSPRHPPRTPSPLAGPISRGAHRSLIPSPTAVLRAQDENFEVKHTGPGLLSMVRRSPSADRQTSLLSPLFRRGTIASLHSLTIHRPSASHLIRPTPDPIPTGSSLPSRSSSSFSLRTRLTLQPHHPLLSSSQMSILHHHRTRRLPRRQALYFRPRHRRSAYRPKDGERPYRTQQPAKVGGQGRR